MVCSVIHAVEEHFSSKRAAALIIIPTYNEKESICRLLQELMQRYAGIADILVIDDNSPDGTADSVRSLPQDNGFALLVRQAKLGLGTAYITGFRYALQHNYQYVIEMDADYSHDPALISELLAAIVSADVVIGSRYLNNTVNVVNWPLSRLILSKMASLYTRLITQLPIADPTSGFKCFRSEVLRSLNFEQIQSQGYSFQIEMNVRAWKKGFVLKEIPIVFVDRTVGKSKMSRKNIVEAIWMVWWLKLQMLFGRL